LKSLFISQKFGINLFIIQSISLAPEYNHITVLTSHRGHCIKSYVDCNFNWTIL